MNTAPFRNLLYTLTREIEPYAHISLRNGISECLASGAISASSRTGAACADAWNREILRREEGFEISLQLSLGHVGEIDLDIHPYDLACSMRGLARHSM